MLCPRCQTINPNRSQACATCGDRLDPMWIPAPQSAPPPGPERTSGMAIAGFVLGFLWLLALPGLIFSIVGYRESRRSEGRVGGAGLALAGIIISSLMLLISLMTL